MISAFKLYMLSVMEDKRKGILSALMKGILRILSLFYALAIKIVDWGYSSGMRRQHKVLVPVVSVGNITLGGTGKTPFAIFLAQHFADTGKKPAVLTRGYGDDERRMLRDELPDIPVFIGQDRIKSALAAIENKRDVLVLDDGFQHRRIGRDLNILMLDSSSLFGNGFLFPRGILREPPSSVRRADILVLSKIDKISADRKKDLIDKLNLIAPGKLIITARHKPVFLNDVTGAVHPLESLRGQDVCLLSGIADPDYFESVVKSLGASIVLRSDYADHHDYSQGDINKIRRALCDEKIGKIITTKKDYVKMQSLDLSSIEEKLFILDIEIDIVDEKEALVDRLNSIVSG